ncbi:MAG: SMC-Scp complex subunit ScpB [Candidatus Omnitrophica bacterium]|nr:SMC-Scp complex subunit ScpB [Candidatus Omnitrophota bacterium]
MTDTEAKRALEALLLVSHKPLLLEQAQEALGPSSADGPPFDPAHLVRLLTEMAGEYAQANRGIRIVEVAQGYQMVTDPQLYPFVSRFTHRVKAVRLSKPSLETLAIIAYRQPVTRVEIEQVRGVDCSGVLDTLLRFNLIRVQGRKEVVGRPLLYGTTMEFLDHFGLKNLKDLPTLEELKGPIAGGPLPQQDDSQPAAQTD